LDEETKDWKKVAPASIVEATERIPRLKELRSALDGYLEIVRKTKNENNKNLEGLIDSWETFWKSKLKTQPISPTDALWMEIARLSIRVFYDEKIINDMEVQEVTDYFNSLHVTSTNFCLLAEDIEKRYGKAVTKEEVQSLVDQATLESLTNFKATLERREENLKRRWIRDKFGGSPPK